MSLTGLTRAAKKRKLRREVVFVVIMVVERTGGSRLATRLVIVVVTVIVVTVVRTGSARGSRSAWVLGVRKIQVIVSVTTWLLRLMMVGTTTLLVGSIVVFYSLTLLSVMHCLIAHFSLIHLTSAYLLRVRLGFMSQRHFAKKPTRHLALLGLGKL